MAREPRRKMKRARSAGGVVFRRGADAPSPAGDPRILLLQHETGKWMLPKGTIERGETPDRVALREVAEETGLHNVRIVADLGEEHYMFFWKAEDTYYDKTVHYYLMEFLGGEEPHPQREEGFVRCEWVTLPDAVDRIKYKETRQVVQRARVALDQGVGASPAGPAS
ncbi:MAG TPA: NUDIX domain-containing protein [bacterium]|nr:NUDIX domain-containing protein [bacterium]